MTEKILENIYKIEVPMGKGALNCLNAYLILGERNLLIDTGFDREEPYRVVTGALEELGTSMEHTDIFLTHMHPDHAELAGRLAQKNTKVYIGAADAALLSDRQKTFNVRSRDPASKGFPADVVIDYERIHALRTPFDKHCCDYTEVHDGDILEYGGYKIECIDCAGHSPGQICLFIAEKKLLFAGDHILYDITPNVSSWDDGINPLEDYIRNLKKLKNLDIEIALPAHRSITCGAKERIDQILVHHNERLEEVIDKLDRNGAMSPYAIASALKWNTESTWEELPAFQKYSAVGEVIAHLAYLMSWGRVDKEIIDSVSLYSKRILLSKHYKFPCRKSMRQGNMYLYVE